MIHEIKLLGIHKRRLEIMEQQQAKVGVHYSATLLMEIDEVKNQITDIEAGLKRRLQALREKAAIYGLSADPAISIEIEDIEKYFE
jgi:hypothetical protein